MKKQGRGEGRRPLAPPLPVWQLDHTLREYVRRVLKPTRKLAPWTEDGLGRASSECRDSRKTKITKKRLSRTNKTEVMLLVVTTVVVVGGQDRCVEGQGVLMIRCQIDYVPSVGSILEPRKNTSLNRLKTLFLLFPSSNRTGRLSSPPVGSSTCRICPPKKGWARKE